LKRKIDTPYFKAEGKLTYNWRPADGSMVAKTLHGKGRIITPG
jgi:hypothetical protein